MSSIADSSGGRAHGLSVQNRTDLPDTLTWGQSGPIDVGSQKQLFIDDHVIDSLQGVYRIMNQPLKYAANPIIQMDRCWEADMHFGNSPNLAYDPDRGVYQMWHQAVNYNWSDNLVAY